ncbi:MAG: MmgE/PrpD family protein [Alphaproteobacteria bacterium]|nr:MmgE/PrpD family protein [Alphaproteobacteria bacterium]
MSHAEAVHTLQPAAGATKAIVEFATGLRFEALPDEARHYARRHLLDTVGVMIAGAGGTIATQAETVIKSVRPDGKIPVPGRARRADLLDAAFLGGTAAHGIELDDGYRHGSAHCGCVVIPTALSVGYDRKVSGRALIEAVVAGYETNICLARACAPDLRQRGFHPTSAVGPFGAAMATARLRGLNRTQFANALGLAASSSAGLFAFVAGGGDVKRLHAGHASREGMQAALLAEQGTEGPPNVIEGRDGFMQAFAFGRIDKARPISLPPVAEYGITDCYIKPYACCRHIQPAVEATFGLCNDENIAFGDIKKVEVETYKIAAEHAHVPWDDFASAQLSFPYLMGLAARYRGVKFEHFDDKNRADPAFADFAGKLTVSAPAEIDQLYPKLRPARVTVTTSKGTFVRQADEAWGSRIVPLDDKGLIDKFLDLVGPVHGPAKAKELSERLWTIEQAADVSPLVEALAR